MSTRDVIEVIYGKHARYEVVRSKGFPFLSSDTYAIYRDGKYYKGTYSSLADAVAAARRAG